MVNASGGRHGLAYVAESTYGTTPGPSPAPSMQRFRCGNVTLDLEKGDLVPNESREDGEVAIQDHGNHRAPGTVDFEWCYRAQDDLIAAVLRSEFDINEELRVGVLNPSFTLERRFPDIGRYHRFPGSVMDSLTLSVTQSPDGLYATGSLGVIARTMTLNSTSLGDPADVATGAPFASFRGSVTAAGDPVAILTGFTLQFANGYALQPVVASALSTDPSRQRLNVTGQGTFMFPDDEMLDRFVTEQELAFGVTLADAAGNELALALPRIKYTGGKVPRSDEGPLILTMPFRALRDTVQESSVVMSRSDA